MINYGQCSVAILGNHAFLQWLPLTTGLLRGFHDLGVRAQAFSLDRALSCGEGVQLEEFALAKPDLVLVQFYAPAATYREHDLLERYRARWSGGKWAILAYDNPNDLQAVLDAPLRWPFFERVFTPEPEALAHYSDAKIRAMLLPAWSDPAMFADARLERAGWRANGFTWDVAFMGHQRSATRAPILHALRERVKAEGLRFLDITLPGVWGRQLGELLARTRVGLELLREEAAPLSRGVPYTWTSPRCHLYAACEMPWLAGGTFPEMERDYPSAALGIEHARQVVRDPDALFVSLRKMLALGDEALEAEGDGRFLQLMERHHPRARARAILREMGFVPFITSAP